MPEQNLISFELPADKVQDIIKKIKDIRDEMNFLVKLTPEEKRELLKLGDRLEPFVEKAISVLDMHPQIMSSLFNEEEFRKDYSLFKTLLPILNELKSLTEAVEDTVFASGSDALTAALEVYAAVQLNRDKIAGMDTIHQEMKGFFNKSKKKNPPPQQ